MSEGEFLISRPDDLGSAAPPQPVPETVLTIQITAVDPCDPVAWFWEGCPAMSTRLLHSVQRPLVSTSVAWGVTVPEVIHAVLMLATLAGAWAIGATAAETLPGEMASGMAAAREAAAVDLTGGRSSWESGGR